MLSLAFEDIGTLCVFIVFDLQDPKRKVHKPIKGVLRLEIEKMHAGYDDLDNSSENGSITNDSLDVGYRCFDIAKCSSNGSNGLQHGTEWGAMDVKEGYKDGSNVLGGPCSDNVADCVSTAFCVC